VHDVPRAAPPRRVGPLAARLRRGGRRLRRGPGRHARGGLPPHLRHHRQRDQRALAAVLQGRRRDAP